MSLGRKGSVMNSITIQIILIGIILALFLVSISGKIESRGVKQQVLEKEVALLIDSGVSGMSFEVRKVNLNGIVSDVRLEEGKVFVDVEGLHSLNGYAYFSKHSVSVFEEEDKFVVRIN